MRETLIELLDKVHHTDMGKTYQERICSIADYLIANGVTISDHADKDTKCTASLHFEAEYAKAMEELKKAKYENEYLRDELRNAKQALSWYEAMKQTVEVIFGRKFEHG